jgi:hypothetical protein
MWLTTKRRLSTASTGTTVIKNKENQSMRRIVRLLFAMMLAILSGCAIGQPNGDVDVSVWDANYTESYIYDFSIQTAAGKDTGAGGAEIAEFAQGGTGGRECCALVPGVGQTIKVTWRAGRRDEDSSRGETYSRDVVVIGTMPRNTRDHSVLIVRFFPSHEVEAEIFPGDGDFGPTNSRIDKIFFVGPRVMRHIGE